MPKRAPSPETGNDIRVIAVYFPYPPHANLEKRTDQYDLVSWLADVCGGTHHLLAICHKPRAPDAVLLEISKDFEDWRQLLGEHKWNQCFHNAVINPADAARSSKIFFATYHNHRAVEKDGWKAIMLDDAFMTNVKQNLCRDPYPPSTWCTVPVGDMTNKSFARALPVDLFPPPVTASNARVVVGSDAWAQRNGIPTKSRPVPGAAPPAPVISKGKKTHNIQPNSAPTSAPTYSKPTVPNAWGKGTQALLATTTPTAARRNAPHATTNLGSARRNAWDPIVSPSAGTSSRTWGSETDSNDGWGQSSSIPTSQASAYDDDPEDEYCGPLYGEDILTLSNSLTSSRIASSLMDPTAAKGTSLTSFDTPDNPAAALDAIHTEEVENVWGDVSSPSNESDIDPKYLCPFHDKICNPKICSMIMPHLRKLGKTVDDFKAIGPHNMYTQERLDKLNRTYARAYEHDKDTEPSAPGSSRRRRGGAGGARRRANIERQKGW